MNIPICGYIYMLATNNTMRMTLGVQSPDSLCGEVLEDLPPALGFCHR